MHVPESGDEFKYGYATRAEAQLLEDARTQSHTHGACRDLWKIAQEERPGDAFIGIIDRKDWTFYAAPCFGITRETVRQAFPGLDSVDISLRMNSGDIPLSLPSDGSGRVMPEVQVVSSPTSGSPDLDRMVPLPLREVLMTYGHNNACIVVLDENGKFDGNSHKAMFSWIKRQCGTDVVKKQALGFAIQRDQSGYYLRYASSLNEREGQGLTETFRESREYRQRHPDREERDLPKDWARLAERVLARDLRLAVVSRERIVARDDSKTSKVTRVLPVPDLHLDRLHRGTVGTGNRLV
jgi:hypothetical protein